MCIAEGSWCYSTGSSVFEVFHLTAVLCCRAVQEDAACPAVSLSSSEKPWAGSGAEFPVRLLGGILAWH